MAINLESGGFGGVKRGELDLVFDASTVNPGTHVFEKMISGAYMGGLGLTLLRRAAKEGLLSASAAAQLDAIEDLSTKEFDDFLGNPWQDGLLLTDEAFTPEDREVMIHLGSAVVARAALLTAINIAGTVLKSGAGHDALHPVCVNIDGSTFHKTNYFTPKVIAHLATLLVDREIYYEAIQVENAPVIGAAIAGLIS
jgi:hexokinase